MPLTEPVRRLDRERKIAALRRLAERPGTEAEGIAARAALERLGASDLSTTDPWELFRQFLRTGDMETLWEATKDHHICACGSAYARGTPYCSKLTKHWDIQAEIKRRFPLGTRVYYNKWAYTANDPATVVGYSQKPSNWNCIRVQFDNLKTKRSIPIFEYDNWHLSTEPIPEGPQADLLRGITEAMRTSTEARTLLRPTPESAEGAQS
jgi:hypothetical protein